MASRADSCNIASLQNSQSNIRNFCILAHVDHGKTTLSDSLVSSNGIISAKLAGKLRYLDSTEEEQKRGITMHSSAISLLFKNEDKAGGGAAANPNDATAPEAEQYLVNLIDSPGHIDFSSDVSTATRLCDGALLVVDVLEGICTQTHAVVYKALKERMRPCLVLNKIDRLCIDMKLSSTEAFHHLKRLLEQVNALAYTLLKSEILKRNEALSVQPATDANKSLDAEIEDDPLFPQWNFEPDKGNVIFCSALDCWGFGTAKFATMWAKRLEINRNVLRKYIFEDYALNTTTKKIVKLDTARSGGVGEMKPMFATMVLDPLWELYEAAVVEQDAAKAASIASTEYKIVLPPREINPRDTRATLQAIMRRWLPLSEAVLRMIVRTVPDPITAQRQRLFTLLPGVTEQAGVVDQGEATAQSLPPPPATPLSAIDYSKSRLPLEVAHAPRTEEVCKQIAGSYDAVKDCVARCDNSPDAPVVVFVSKMVPVRVAELSQRDIAMVNARLARAAEAAVLAEGEVAPPSALKPDGEVFVALARVFSGTLTRNSPLYVLGSKYDPRNDPHSTVGKDGSADESAEEATQRDITGLTRLPADMTMGLYIMLGPSVVPVEQVPAGNIVGIVGLSEMILKTATLSSTWATYPMNAITFQSKPMLKVAVEPISHVDLRALEFGLQQLHQFDPVVEIGVDNDTGQNTMTCLGELHLEQCVKALTERFAKCQVNVSEPLIAFRETVLSAESSSSEAGSKNAAPVLPPPWCDITGLSHARGGRYRVLFGSGNVAITVRCFPLHISLARLLEDQGASLSEIDESLSELQRRLQSAHDNAEISTTVERFHKGNAKFWSDLSAAVESPKNEVEEEVVDPALLGSHRGSSAESHTHSRRVLSVGSPQHGTNMLIFDADATASIWRNALPAQSGDLKSSNNTQSGNADSAEGEKPSLAGKIALRDHPVLFYKLWARLHSACTAAFRMAVEAGPLMREPMHAVGFSIEAIEVNAAVASAALTASEMAELSATVPGAIDAPSSADSSAGSGTILTGQLISEMREALHVAALSLPVRIVEPVYKCDLQCDQSQIGNLYAVLSQRRGEVTSEDIIEGTTLFLLSAHLPVHSSFGFAQQLLKKTSGLGTAPQLSFSHWSRMDADPFWRPKTEDELEEFGEHGIAGVERNLPRSIIDAVRKRKGLAIEEKVVMFAEKQRTLNKKK